jgi:hypothetical protein
MVKVSFIPSFENTVLRVRGIAAAPTKSPAIIEKMKPRETRMSATARKVTR